MGILLLCWFWAYSAKFRIWGHVQHVSWYQDQRHFQHPTRQCGRVPWILFWPNSHVIQCYACIFVFLGGTFWLSKRVHWPATVPPGPASAERIAAMSIPIGRPRDSLVCCLKIWEGENSKTAWDGFRDSNVSNIIQQKLHLGWKLYMTTTSLSLSCCIQAALHQPNVSHLDHLLLISSRMFHQDISSELIKVANQQDPRTSRSMPNLIPKNSFPSSFPPTFIIWLWINTY